MESRQFIDKSQVIINIFFVKNQLNLQFLTNIVEPLAPEFIATSTTQTTLLAIWTQPTGTANFYVEVLLGDDVIVNETV